MFYENFQKGWSKKRRNDYDTRKAWEKGNIMIEGKCGLNTSEAERPRSESATKTLEWKPMERWIEPRAEQHHQCWHDKHNWQKVIVLVWSTWTALGQGLAFRLILIKREKESRTFGCRTAELMASYPKHAVTISVSYIDFIGSMILTAF